MAPTTENVQTPTPTEINQGGADEEEVIEQNPDASEIPSSEPIQPPPSESANLPFARLVFTDEAAGIPQQQSSAKNQEVVDTPSSSISVTLPKAKYATPTDLVEDPMLTPTVMKKF